RRLLGGERHELRRNGRCHRVRERPDVAPRCRGDRAFGGAARRRRFGRAVFALAEARRRGAASAGAAIARPYASRSRWRRKLIALRSASSSPYLLIEKNFRRVSPGRGVHAATYFPFCS